MPTPASPGTNQYRCEYCGRYFNEKEDLEEHQKSCAEAMRTGRVNKETEQPKAEPAKPDRDWRSTP